MPANKEKFGLKPATCEQIRVKRIDERLWRITLTIWNQNALSIPNTSLLSLEKNIEEIAEWKHNDLMVEIKIQGRKKFHRKYAIEITMKYSEITLITF